MKIRHDNGPQDRDDAFDHAMRGLHAQALTQVSPHTRARLREARTAANQRAPTRGWHWPLATGLAALVALAIGLQWQAPPSSDNAPARTAAVDPAAYNALAALDETPDLYLWLASNDDALAATRER